MSPKKLLAVPALLCVLSLVATAQTRVQILHASDLEGGVTAIADAPNFAAIVDALEADAASQNVTSLLLSAGDNYIPGPFFSAAGDFSLRQVLRTVTGNPDAREGVGRVDAAIMNALGIDASAVGNHEFDGGTSIMESIIGTDIRSGPQYRWLGVDFPYLSANLDFSADGALSGLFTSQILPSTAFRTTIGDPNAGSEPKLARATTITRNGETFGVVGATTQLVESISSTGGVTVVGPNTNDMVALAAQIQPTIDQLLAQGVDKIILVTHLQQLALEQTLVPLLTGVDICIAGGSDTILADATDRLRAGDVAGGTYPVVTTNGAGEPALIVSTDGEYSYVGRLVVDFDANGVIVPASVNASESGAFAADEQGVIDLYGSVAAGFTAGSKGDAVKTLTDAVSAVVIAKDSNVFGSASVYLEGRREFVRTEETNLGNFTADANLFYARQVDPTVQVSLKNGGGIRAEIGSIDGITGVTGPTLANPQSGKQAGEISQLDIENSLRFNNGLTLLTLTRAQLKEVLEHAVAAWAPGATPGQFGQVGGVSFSFDPNLPAGSRVRNAVLTTPGAGEQTFVQNGAVVGTAPVRVVTLNFLADGGDSYPYPSFAGLDPAFFNRVDLDTVAEPGANAATFVSQGTEQDAMAEYLAANFVGTPFNVADTPASGDLRIQNLAFRADTVLSQATDYEITVSQDLLTPSPIQVQVVGADANANIVNLFSFQTFNGNGPLLGVGLDALPQLFYPFGTEPFLVTADANGEYSFTLPTGFSTPATIEAVTFQFAVNGFGTTTILQVSPVSGPTNLLF